eukprot:gnl/MRDRNA2_/MRDRNA2_89308_c1_seq1.p1 gnl/MRDRNA2_/MRDRNA2_89308_c1~~gnl/MRDRNA2_/MRDRNA2_89308_c1_seq1.p1  ORF type:complete len:356 (-),score=88.03 gnl/MRDRNA2_/MRDRNA2_89308_c1_seq1:287-1204(-)
MAAMQKLQASIQRAGTFQTDVIARAPRRLDAHESSGGMMDPKCQEACPGVMEMLLEMMTSMSATSTTPTPGSETAVMMEMLCAHADTLSCLGKAEACASDDTESMAALTCVCDCPGIIVLTSGGDAMEAMCANPDAIMCMFEKESCKAMTAMMSEGAGGMNADTMQKQLAIQCKASDLGCGEKMEKMATCGGEALSNWETAECGDDITEVCCPWGETIVECMDKQCVKLQIAAQKVAADAGDEDSKKDMESTFKTAKTCTSLGLPQNEEEAAALVPGSEEPPASDFACHQASMLAAATAVCAVVV